jgi:hypothetical protein
MHLVGRGPEWRRERRRLRRYVHGDLCGYRLPGDLCLPARHLRLLRIVHKAGQLHRLPRVPHTLAVLCALRGFHTDDSDGSKDRASLRSSGAPRTPPGTRLALRGLAGRPYSPGEKVAQWGRAAKSPPSPKGLGSNVTGMSTQGGNLQPTVVSTMSRKTVRIGFSRVPSLNQRVVSAKAAGAPRCCPPSHEGCHESAPVPCLAGGHRLLRFMCAVFR